MLKNQSDTANILRERSKLNKRLAYEGLLVGIASGAVCIVYRLVLSNAESIYFTIGTLWHIMCLIGLYGSSVLLY